jgi:hypothetical protein
VASVSCATICVGVALVTVRKICPSLTCVEAAPLRFDPPMVMRR